MPKRERKIKTPPSSLRLSEEQAELLRTRGKGSAPASQANLRPSPLAGPKLGADERTIVVRARVSAATAEWFLAMTSPERGKLIDRLHEEQQKSQE